MIKAFIFDFAGVISEEGYNNWLKKNVPEFKKNYQHFLDIAREGDEGIAPMDSYLSHLSKATGVPVDKIWPTMRGEFIIHKEMLTLIQELRKTYKIGLLSNFTKGWLEQILTEGHLYPYFDAITISSEIHVVKPDPAIFQNILEKLQVRPEESMFVDDKIENVQGAVKIGMEGILFTTVDSFIHELRKLGILNA